MVQIIGKSCSKKLQFGESLTPEIKTLLVSLGIWKDFLNDGHLPSPGNISIWGDREFKETNFIFHPDNFGWHLESFEVLLDVSKWRKESGYFLFKIRN